MIFQRFYILAFRVVDQSIAAGEEGLGFGR
jgi:hypothetical protein